MARKENVGDNRQLFITVGAILGAFIILWIIAFVWSSFLFSGTYKLAFSKEKTATIKYSEFGSEPTFNFGMFNSVTFTEKDENGELCEYKGTYELTNQSMFLTDGTYTIKLPDYSTNNRFETHVIKRYGDYFMFVEEPDKE